jgi:ubiquinone/menaquinone biosynthesis C-methylase UbiE
MRFADGSAGDADYAAIGTIYTRYRQPETLILERIKHALGDAQTVLNVGAGAGSYEPLDRDVVAIEPSASMRSQRPPHLVPAIDAVAENLPYPDRHFDASMATFTVHQWENLQTGLVEMRRVTKGPVVILTCDPDEVTRFWLNVYAPEVLATEARRYPATEAIERVLAGTVCNEMVPIPLHCKDGFNEAYYGRPEKLLDRGAREACSAWSFVNPSVTEAYVQALRRELENGSWDSRYGHLRLQPQYEGSLRLLICKP